MFIFLFLFSISFSQLVPFEFTSTISSDDQFPDIIYIEDEMIGNRIDMSLKQFINMSLVESEMIYETKVKTESLNTITLKILYSDLPVGTKFFLIDNRSDGFAGPFYSSHSSGALNLGPIHSSDFIIQYIVPELLNLDNHNIYISEVSNLSSAIIPKEKSYYARSNDRENPVIVVTGFWPPTNEMIRHFSQDLNLNPNGWAGEDWRGSGYDIISFFPEFDNPDCDDCGQGYGDFEVDYQDTSGDFWTLVSDLNPSTIITFSRGYIDNSWELEYNYYNRTNWYGDYTAPFQPTPNPPDDDAPINYLRNSTLPMQDIVDEINISNLGLNSYIDINGDPGHFVSEFMGYHGVWYHDLYEFDSVNPCYLAGHVHVGGLIDWDTARQAAELTIEKVISELDEYVYTPGDANSDENIDILDIVTSIAHILGQDIISGGAFYAADMNSDGVINIQDIILIINLIL